MELKWNKKSTNTETKKWIKFMQTGFKLRTTWEKKKKKKRMWLNKIHLSENSVVKSHSLVEIGRQPPC